MILIGENIHIISPYVREALLNKNESIILTLLDKQKNMDFVDLNVGPARGDLKGVMSWLTEIVMTHSEIGISFDTTNSDEMFSGLMKFNRPENISSEFVVSKEIPISE